MIIIDKLNEIFHLQTPNTSYIFRKRGEYILEHLYFGKRINDLTGIIEDIDFKPGFSALNSEYRKEGIDLTTETIPLEYSFFGSCDMRKPAFHAIYSDGSRISKPEFVSYSVSKGKKKILGLPAVYTENDSEADTLEIIFIDKHYGLKLKYRYSVFNDMDVITRNVSIENINNEPFFIKSAMSFNLDFTDKDFDLIHLSGAWCRERHIERNPIMQGMQKIESRRGSSSHHHSPFFALADKQTTEDSGEVYAFSLLYSGNFEAGVERDTFGGIRAFMGINSFDFSWKLEKDEIFETPEVVMVYSSEGMGKMSSVFHNLYRQRLARGKYKNAMCPVLINNWEATYFDFDEEKLLNIATKAKKLGIELFVLDDGWFGERNNSSSSLGDWYENRNKLPHGLKGLAEKINEIGLQFGLWFEPEGISPNSCLYEKHPEWCIQVPGREGSLSRNQLLLDLSRADVCEFIIDTVSNILNSANISYVKWDMNRNMTEVGSCLLPPDRQSETSHRYILGLYKVLETLKERFPNILFEGCSGGGGRFDAGMMYYFDQYWTSDDTDAIERIFIQHGTSYVMPTIFMGAHVSVVPNHQTKRITPFKTRGDVALCGKFGYELDITQIDDCEAEMIVAQIQKYKEIREVVQKGTLYRLASPFEENFASWEFVSKDADTIVLFCCMIKMKPQTRFKKLHFKGLDNNAVYRLCNNDKVFSGDVLENVGFSVHLSEDFESEIYTFKKISR